MKTNGILFILLGIVVIVVSFFLTTTVSSSSSMFSDSGTYNIGLMQRQMLVFYSGALIILIGTILYACGKLFESLSNGQDKTNQLSQIDSSNEIKVIKA